MNFYLTSKKEDEKLVCFCNPIIYYTFILVLFTDKISLNQNFHHF